MALLKRLKAAKDHAEGAYNLIRNAQAHDINGMRSQAQSSERRLYQAIEELDKAIKEAKQLARDV
jgi:hypothetical protein